MAICYNFNKKNSLKFVSFRKNYQRNKIPRPMAGGFVRPYRKVFTFPVRSSHEFRAACSTSRACFP